MGEVLVWFVMNLETLQQYNSITLRDSTEN